VTRLFNEVRVAAKIWIAKAYFVVFGEETAFFAERTLSCGQQLLTSRGLPLTLLHGSVPESSQRGEGMGD
jgi:hypothetical protein